MSPRVKGKRAELPKSVVCPGSLGCLPLTPWTLSCVQQDRSDLLIGYWNTAQSQAFKQQPQIRLNGQADVFSLDGRFFNGYTDALYRGKLPQVILAAPLSEQWDLFLDDFAEYLEKILSLGFFLPKKEVVKRDPVDDLIPCFILVGSGLRFSRFATGLMHYFKTQERLYPVLTEAVQMKILGRFVRGIPEQSETMDAGELTEPPQASAKLVSVASQIRIAGGSRETLQLIQSVLAKYGWVTDIENRAKNPVERLEFENALWRLSKVIIPTLVQDKTISADDVKTLKPRLEAGLIAIGRHRQVFDATEESTQLLAAGSAQNEYLNQASVPVEKPMKKQGGTKPETTIGKSLIGGALRQEDKALLNGLSRYAEFLGLTAERDLFAELATRASQTAQ